jgi:hypothetical protein
MISQWLGNSDPLRADRDGDTDTDTDPEKRDHFA